MLWRRKRNNTASIKTPVNTLSTIRSTMTPKVPTTSTQTLPRRGDWMGISAGATASLRVLNACVDLGLGWVRLSHEYGWTNTVANLQTTVTEAHKRGLKVLQAIQKAGHTYSLNDVNALAGFAQQCVAIGIDAIELGNEWNNPPFFMPDEQPAILGARITASLGQMLRTQYPNLPIITAGMSPRPETQTPHLWWPTWWDQNATAHTAARYSAQALHPYVYPEDPAGLIGHPEWNPWWALPIIRDAMTSRGIGDQSVWFTEVGCPGDRTGQTIIRGIVCDEQRQAFVTSQYLKQWQTHGRPGEPIFIATAHDGDSVSVPGPEQHLGLIRTDGTRKPAWQIVHDHAALPR